MPPTRTNADLISCVAEDIAAILATFSETDMTAKQGLQEMFNSDPASFTRASVSVLATLTSEAAARYLVQLLSKQRLLLEELVNPERLKTEAAAAAAQALTRLGSPIEKELERALDAALRQPQSAMVIGRIARILDLLAAISAPRTCLLFQAELMAHGSSAVRSRAAMLIARSGKNSAFVARLMLDPDPEVQAAVVEALWNLGAAEARPLLLAAVRSRNSRVAANAVLGLYRLGDVASIGLMLEMARQTDSGFLETAIWAMGEAGDPRFLPFLMDRFQRSAGPERMAVLRSLGCIRRKEREQDKADPIEIRISEAVVRADGTRRLAITLRSPGNQDLSGMKATSFAVWEGGALIEDYSVAAAINPALLIAAFVLPRFDSSADPYRAAILEGMDRALRFRRPDDLWRIDRYLMKASLKGPPASEKATIPYDEALLGSTKTLRGFLTSQDLLRKTISAPGPRERSASDVAAAIERVVDAMRRIAGTRHLFIFLQSGGNDVDSRRMQKLREFVQEERLVLHGFAPEDATGCEPLRDLCLAIEGGTFQFTPPEQVPQIVERIYSNLLNRFKVTYKAPGGAGAAEGAVVVSSENGCGRAEYSFAAS